MDSESIIRKRNRQLPVYREFDENEKSEFL